MRFEYTTSYGIDCYCEVELHGDVLVVTEPDNNTGVSVTNNVAELAKLLRSKFGIRGGFTFIEHYPKRGNLPETFDEVTFEPTRWKRISKEQYYLLIGEPIGK